MQLMKLIGTGAFLGALLHTFQCAEAMPSANDPKPLCSGPGCNR